MKKKKKYLTDGRLSVERAGNEQNLALGKVAVMRDNKGKEIEAYQKIAIPHFALDGRLNTYAQAENFITKAPRRKKGEKRKEDTVVIRKDWVFEVDLGREFDFDKVSLIFKSGLVPNDVKIAVSQKGSNWQEITNAKGKEKMNFSFKSIRGRYVRISVAGDKGVAIAELSITSSKPQSPWQQAPAGTDLALGKRGRVLHALGFTAPVTQYKKEPANFAKHALDGNDKTYTQVQLGGLDYDWAYLLDLGEIHNISKVQLNCEQVTDGTKVQILTSNDEQNWKKGPVKNLNNGKSSIDLGKTKARYVKVIFTGRYARELRLKKLSVY